MDIIYNPLNVIRTLFHRLCQTEFVFDICLCALISIYFFRNVHSSSCSSVENVKLHSNGKANSFLIQNNMNYVSDFNCYDMKLFERCIQQGVCSVF